MTLKLLAFIIALAGAAWLGWQAMHVLVQTLFP